MNELNKRLKFRWVTEVEWLRISPWERDMYTRYTIWSSESNPTERKLLYEWMGGGVVPTNVYSKEEIDLKLRTWTIDGGNQ